MPVGRWGGFWFDGAASADPELGLPIEAAAADQTIVCNLLTDAAVVNSPGVAYIISANLLAGPTTVNAPTVVPGSVTVVSNLLANPATVNGPAVVLVISTNLTTAPVTVNSPTVVPGSVTVVMNLVADSAVVNSPQIYQIVKVDVLSDPAVVNTPNVAYTQTVTFAGILSDPTVVNTPNVTYTQTATFTGVLTDPAVVNTPSVQYTQTVTVPLVVSSARGVQFYATETFTGADATASVGPNWYGGGDIFSNQMRLTTGEQETFLVELPRDIEFTWDHEHVGGSTVNYMAVSYRGDFENGFSFGTFNNYSYRLLHDSFTGSVTIAQFGLGAYGSNMGGGTAAVAPGDVFHWKVRLVGDLHKIKWWKNSDPEPAAWQISFTDRLYFGPHINFSNSCDGGGKSQVDNFTVRGIGTDWTYWDTATPNFITDTNYDNFEYQFHFDAGDVATHPSITYMGSVRWNYRVDDDDYFGLFIYSNQLHLMHINGAGNATLATYIPGANLFNDNDDVRFRIVVNGSVRQVYLSVNAGSEILVINDTDATDFPRASGFSPYDGVSTIQFLIETHSVYAPTVAMSVGMEVVDAPATVYSPAVAQTVSVGALAAPATVYQPTVILLTQIVVMHLLVTSGAGCGPFEIGESYVGDCDELAAEDSGGVSEPSVLTVNYVVLDLLAAPATVYEPSVDFVGGGAQNIEMQLVAAPATVNAPAVYYVIQLDVLADPAVVNAPALYHIVVVDVINDPAVVNAPVVAHVISMQVVADPAVVNSPTLYEIIKIDVLSDPATVNAPSVVYVVKLDVINDPATVLTPNQVAPGAVTISMQLVADPATVNSPTVYYIVQANSIADPAVVNAPTVAPGAVTVVANLVVDAAVVNSPQVYQIVKVDALSDPAVVNSPAVAPIVQMNLVSAAATVNSPRVAHLQYVTVPVLNSSIRQVAYEFTGSDGASVDGWTTMDALAAPDLLNNRMRVDTGEGAWIDVGITGDCVVSFDLIFDSLGPVVSLFGTSSASTGGADQSLDNAEVFNLAPFSGNPSFPGGTVITGAVEDTDTIHFHFEVISGVVYAYVWINADPMPGSPSHSWTLTYTGSYFAFASINGAQAFDNFTVTKYMGVQTPEVDTLTTVQANVLSAPSTVLTPASVTIVNYVRPPCIDSNFRGVSFDFTDADGDPPPGAFITMGGGTAPEIQGNKLQFTSGDRVYIDTGLTGDRTLQWDFTWASVGASGTYIAASTTNTGSAIFLDDGENWNVFFLGSVFGVSVTPVVNGDIIHVLIEIVGYNADIYVWKNADPQPGSPSTTEAINPANYGPYVAFSTMSNTYDLDNFSAGQTSGVQTPTVSPQPVYINANLISAPAVVNSPAVNTVNYVTVPLVVTAGYGSGGYGSGTYGDSNVLTPSVARAVVVGPLADPAVVNAPTLFNITYLFLPVLSDPSEVFAPIVYGGRRLVPLQVISYVQPIQTIDAIEKVVSISPAEQRVTINARDPIQTIAPNEAETLLELLYN